jgi:hypothetical protein
VPEIEGGFTLHLPDGEPMSDLRRRHEVPDEGVPLIVLAGKEYGTGSSRDWAAKGPRLLGVRAVIAESYERIHRSNLVGMGVRRSNSWPARAPSRWGSPGARPSTSKGWRPAWPTTSPTGAR